MAVYEEKESYAASRAGGVGGTDAAAILGLSPYKRPIDIWAGKVDPTSQIELDKECLVWGNLLEPVIRKQFASKFEVAVAEPSQLATYFPKSRPWNDSMLIIGHEPWMLGAPDGWMHTENAGLEIKTAARRSGEWGDEYTDEIPAHYLAQAAWYTMVTGANRWEFAVLFSGNTLQRFNVPRDQELEREMVDTCRAFWFDYVVRQVEPPIDESESYGKYLARKFSMPTGKTLATAPAAIVQAAIELRDAQQATKAAEEAEQFAKNKLAAAMGPYDKAVTPVGSVGWVRPGPRNVIDYKAVIAEAMVPQSIIDSHTKDTPVSAYCRGWWKKN